MTRKTTRRDFIRESVALGTACWVSGRKVVAAEKSPLERLNVAAIGAQGKGGSDISNTARWGANVVAMCDIDDNHLRKKALEFRQAELFNDYREMLDRIADRIDVVTISTPDHSHAAAGIMAMNLGKHVYCQKPLTWSIFEARRMREVAEKTGVVTQMGNQGTSQNGLREAVEVVRSGGIGAVSEVHVWTNRPIWPQGRGRPDRTDTVPPHVHWDLFLGPAPERPYLGDKTYHPFNWRGWLDFGTGALGDMACHTANLAMMACDLFEPTAFEAVKNPGIVDNEQFPAFSEIKFEFDTRGDMPPCEMYWYDGGRLPSEDVLPTDLLPDSLQKEVRSNGRAKALGSGSLLVGSKGKLFSPHDYGGTYHLLPQAHFGDDTPPDPWLPRIEANGSDDERHMWEFIAACKGEGETMAGFGRAGRLTETVLAGNLALRTSGRLEWDAETMTCTNNSAANQFVHREYRSGWTV